jgi:hypothetical protein
MAQAVVAIEGVVAIEWPASCAYRKVDGVASFLEQREFDSRIFHGCVCGLVSRCNAPLGTPIEKPWRCSSNNFVVLNHLNLRCSGDHPCNECQGRDCKMSEEYTPRIIDAIRKGFSACCSVYSSSGSSFVCADMVVPSCPMETPHDTRDYIVRGEMVDIIVDSDNSPYGRIEIVQYFDEHVEYIEGISMFSCSLPTSFHVALFAPAIVRCSIPAASSSNPPHARYWSAMAFPSDQRVNMALAESPAVDAAAVAKRGASARAKAVLAAVARNQAKAARGKSVPATVVAKSKPSQEYIPELTGRAVGPVEPSSVWTAPPPAGGNAGVWTLPEGEEPAQTAGASNVQDDAGTASIGAVSGAGSVQDAAGAPAGVNVPPTNPRWSADAIRRQALARAAATSAAGAPTPPSGVIIEGPAEEGRQRIEKPRKAGRRSQPVGGGQASGSGGPMNI